MRRCANKDAGPRRGWTPDAVPARTLSSEGGWIIRSQIDWREEQNILYKGVETSL